MIKLSSAWPKLSSQKGYILLELTVSIIITVFLLTMLIKGYRQLLPSWNKIYCQTNLYNAGHYMLSIMEKNIGYEAVHIKITKDKQNVDKLICQTNNGNQSYIFTYEENHIYKTITKANTSGKNPLYVSDCLIKEWQLSRLNDRLLKIDMTLEQKRASVKLSKIINCVNGRIETDAS